jgi:hypothetical protein
MSYIVNLPDGTLLTTILDGTIDNTHCSLTLVGRNYAGYGEIIAEDLVALLVNFARDQSPSYPLQGQLWYDVNASICKVYTGSVWKTVGSAAAAAAAPTTTIAGDLWWDSVNKQLYVYDGTTPFAATGWILVGPAYSAVLGRSGALVEQLSDGVNLHDVVSIYLDNTRTAIIAQESFTPNVSITGFSTLNVGYNMSTAAIGSIWGTANNANYLSGLDSGSFFQRTANNVGTGSLTLTSNVGITLGSRSTFRANVDGGTGSAQLWNLNTGGNISLHVVTPLGQVKALAAYGQDGLLYVKGDPTAALGVATKNYVDINAGIKANIADPVFTGNPQAPTAAVGNASTTIATTQFVDTANTIMTQFVGASTVGKANIANPILTGNPQAPTAAAGNASTTIATTQFVAQANLALKGYVDDLNSTVGSNLNTKANIASPTLTGNPQAPTAAAGNASTTIATTQFVAQANLSLKGYIDDIASVYGINISNKANIASPTFTGLPRSVTMPVGTSNTTVATTEFVNQSNVGMQGYVDNKFTNTALLGIPTAVTAPAGTANSWIATTAFVTNGLSGIFPYKIFQQNSWVWVSDSGVGSANIVIDGTQVLTATASGVVLNNGATASTQGQTYNTSGNGLIATTQFVKTATTWWGGSAKFVSTAQPNPGINDAGSNVGDIWFQYIP